MADMMFTISAEALKLIKAGEATLSSGGVRLLDGTIFELAKPAASHALPQLLNNLSPILNNLNPITSVVNVASSLTQNVQSAFILRDIGVVSSNIGVMSTQIGEMNTAVNGISSAIGVMNNNIASLGTGINTIINQCMSISAALSSLQQIAVLSWIGTSFNLANCGISIISFYKTMNKLNGMTKLIENFYDQYCRDREYDVNENYYHHYLNLKSDIGNLRFMQKKFISDKQFIKSNTLNIEEHVNGTIAFIKKLSSELTGKISEDKTNVKMIVSLYVMLSQAINEYCCLYYYTFSESHHMLDEWSGFLGEICSADFYDTFRQHLLFCDDYITISPEKKQQAYLIGVEALNEINSRFETCKTVIDSLPEEQYYCLDDIVNRQLYIEMSTQIPAMKNLDTTLTECIKTDNYFTYGPDKETILLPVAY